MSLGPKFSALFLKAVLSSMSMIASPFWTRVIHLTESEAKSSKSAQPYPLQPQPLFRQQALDAGDRLNKVITESTGQCASFGIGFSEYDMNGGRLNYSSSCY